MALQRAGRASSSRGWEATYRAWLEKDVLTGPHGGERPSRSPIGDQPAFRRCAWQHGMRVATLAPEYNLRLGIQTTVVDRVRLIHGHSDKYETLAERFNHRIGSRTFPEPRPIRRVGRQVYDRLRRAFGCGHRRRLGTLEQTAYLSIRAVRCSRLC